MAKSMWSARNVTRPGDGAGAARTSRAASSYALRNVRWTIAMSRTSIGCAVDIWFPLLDAPVLEPLAGGLSPHHPDLITPGGRRPASRHSPAVAQVSSTPARGGVRRVAARG